MKKQVYLHRMTSAMKKIKQVTEARKCGSGWKRGYYFI